MIARFAQLFTDWRRRVAGRDVRWRLYRRLFSRIVVRTPQGRFLVGTKDDDGIGKTLFLQRSFEQGTIDAVMSTLRENSWLPENGSGVVLDVGANCGVISIALLKQDHMQQAIAIEPEPENFALLTANIALNDLEDRIYPYNVAASEESGMLQFELSSCNHGDHRVRVGGTAALVEERFSETKRKLIEVIAKPIDMLLCELPSTLAASISLVWIDIQGHEGYAFRGGANLFAKPIPVMSEFWPYGILRAGMSRDDYCQIAGKYWGRVWVPKQGSFVEHPIEFLRTYWDELGQTGNFENVLFTR